MRQKTYRNFMRVCGTLQNQHGYNSTASEAIAHRIFDNVEADAPGLGRTAEYFLSQVLTAAEYLKEYGIDERK